MKAGKIISDVLSLYAPKMTIVEAGGETFPVREFTYEQTLGMLRDLHNRIDSMRHVPEVGDNANISDVLCAAFGQYFDAGGIIELDIQDDDQVRPLIAYMAQGVADYFLRDGNKYANLIYRMGETAGALNPAPPTSGDPLNALADDEAERQQYERDKRDPANCLTEPTPAQAVPSGVYYNDEAGNFYSSTTRQGMGGAFFQTWFARRDDFPKSANTPAQAGADALVEAFEDAVIRRMRAYNPDDPMPKDGGSIREELVARNALLAALGAQAGAELPEPAGVLVINGQALRGFTAEQMREMYRRGLKDARLGGQ